MATLRKFQSGAIHNLDSVRTISAKRPINDGSGLFYTTLTFENGNSVDEVVSASEYSNLPATAL